MRLLGQQGLESVKKLFLGTLLVGEELNVINQQQIKRVVALLEFIKSLTLISLDHIRNELLCVDVENFGCWPVVQEAVAHGVHQVGFAQPDTTVDK